MKLIFNKDENGSDELKTLIPYIDADLNYANLKPDIKTATNDIIKLVGQEVYDKAAEAYLDESTTDYQDDFLEAIRYPIAVGAYMLYAPTNDLSHTNDGRKMRSDDGEKSAFEWMIDRDNVAQEKRYYRALEDLLIFLDKARDESDDEFETELRNAWTWSEAFKTSNDIFIRSVDEFDRVFPIKIRLLLIKLTPGIIDCETSDIIPRITKVKYKELKDKLVNRESITDEKDLELIKLIKRATAFSALAWSMPRFSVQLYPEGVLQHYTSDRATTKGARPSLKLEVEVAARAFQEDADKALKEIERLLVPEPTPQELSNIKTTPDIDYGDKYFST